MFPSKLKLGLLLLLLLLLRIGISTQMHSVGNQTKAEWRRKVLGRSILGLAPAQICPPRWDSFRGTHVTFLGMLLLGAVLPVTLLSQP